VFCAVLCTTRVDSDMHTYSITRMSSSYTDDYWFRFSFKLLCHFMWNNDVVYGIWNDCVCPLQMKEKDKSLIKEKFMVGTFTMMLIVC